MDSHAALARSEPLAGAALAEPPAEIRLWFTEPLEASYTGADLLDGRGEPVSGVSFSVAADDAHQLVVRPPALPDGAYTVAWRSLSAADGHTLQGYFGFSVGNVTPGSAAPMSRQSSGPDAARPLTTGLALLGLAALLAIAPMLLGVLGPTAQSIPGLVDGMRSPLRRYV
ncbi:MAG TPA: copper resistance CopC family protein, partial [Thermomicrobiales bacterium]|nr:copper resistance CopC family protein [Thermomicrobiales bacterium]